MALVCEFDLIADVGLMDATPELGIMIDYSEALDAFCETFEEVATDLVPVDTGYLMGSISATNDGYSHIYCIAEAHYAQYVEFGTYKMDAQPYFIPALQEAYAEMMDEASQAIEEALNEETELLEEEMMGENGKMDMGSHNPGSIGGSMGGGFVPVGDLVTAIIGFVFMAVMVGFFEVFLNIAFDNDTKETSHSLRVSAGDDGGGGFNIESYVRIE